TALYHGAAAVFAAALLALISPAEGEANQCRAILSQMKK
ncbi:hypothetical protein, partial [Klebsiella michiganensis]